MKEAQYGLLRQQQCGKKKWTDGATDRINRLRDQFFRNKPELDVFRALVYTRVYQETEAEDLPIRHAKALLAYMTEKPLVIGNDELIIGTEGSSTAPPSSAPKSATSGLKTKWTPWLPSPRPLPDLRRNQKGSAGK